jgi:hypothetical protein
MVIVVGVHTDEYVGVPLRVSKEGWKESPEEGDIVPLGTFA